MVLHARCIIQLKTPGIFVNKKLGQRGAEQCQCYYSHITNLRVNDVDKVLLVRKSTR